MFTALFALLLTTASITPASTPPDRTATLDGGRIHYRVHGRGHPVLVFVHGFGGDEHVWREQVAHFQKKARVITLDLPGHGKSDKPETEYTMRFFARSVKAVMDAARVERAILVGHSMGTPVIRQFDRMYPTRTRALVVVDGMLVPLGTDESRAKMMERFRTGDYRANVEGMFEGILSKADPALRDELKRRAHSVPPHAGMSMFEGMFDPAIWKEDRITVPVLVLNANIPMWTEEYVTRIRKLAPDLEYQLIDGATHFLMLDKPAEFNQRLEQFLKKKSLK